MGFKLVEVRNIATGGTSSLEGNLIIKYGLFPEDMQNPDIIINAYSTNDMARISVQRAQAENRTLADTVFDNMQTFIRTVLTSRPCENPPLLIMLDDYLGNMQYEIKELMTLNTIMKQIAGYYNIMSISYADAVRLIVYADTDESWFSPGPWQKYEHEMNRQVHPFAGGK